MSYVIEFEVDYLAEIQYARIEANTAKEAVDELLIDETDASVVAVYVE